MHSYLGGASKTLGCQPVIVGGVEDHVHILASLGKTISQAEWIKELKRVTSIWAKDLDPRLIEFAWQGGYGAYSVGPDNLVGIQRYIEGQEEHHRKVTFEEEFMQLLEEHGMEWDARDSMD
jgi:putative transposase